MANFCCFCVPCTRAGQQHDSPAFAARGQAGRADENTRERQGAGGDLRSGGEDQRRCLPGPSGWPPQPYHHRAGGSAEAGAGTSALDIDRSLRWPTNGFISAFCAQEYKQYQEAVLANSKALADAMVDRGYTLVSGGTDNHLMLIDMR